MIDGNEAVARVAYATSEVIAIYPITPSSPMGEWADAYAADRIRNVWGTVPSVIEMQSEGGAAGAIHGALQTGALATTFTSSQGLLLMIPNMYKIAGELTPAVFHIAARSVAAHALSIFGDHSDVMAARSTGWAMLCSSSVQEAQDLALISHAATLEARIPFVHFFDGFRTSHEVAKVELLGEEQMRAMIDLELVFDHRSRALSPDHPVIRGTAQNPDVFFQSRERANPYYAACAGIVEEAMERFARITGRRYSPYQYHGPADAERVIVVMGSAAETVRETVEALAGLGEKVGLLQVRLYRPFDAARLIAALPRTVRAIAVLDRTKEPGSAGEPLYLDCIEAFHQAGASGAMSQVPRIVGGRYGLSSKEFTPAMVKAVFDNLAAVEPANHFTAGIRDDVSHSSLDYDTAFSTEPDDVIRSLFYGLGSDGTVGANKNSIKIIGERPGTFAQGYFVYDSKKAGAVTVSHLRFGPRPIGSSYLVSSANFVACHQPVFLDRYEMLDALVDGGTFLLNLPLPEPAGDYSSVFDRLPLRVQQALVQKHARFFVIDANRVARDAGLGGRINTIMQVCFFAVSGVMRRAEAIAAIKDTILKTYGKKGEKVVETNLRAVDTALSNLVEVPVPDREVAGALDVIPFPDHAPEFARDVIATIYAGHGDSLPVSAFPADGTYPTGTSQYEKRNLAQIIPVWDEIACIQCGKCAMVCPHAAIRIKVYDEDLVKAAPPAFKRREPAHKDWKGMMYSIQVAPEDCTGCELCADVCPAKSKAADHKALYMQPQAPLLEAERANWDFFLGLPEYDRRKLTMSQVRQVEVAQPLFEFSGACSGCGETPYLKLLTQLFGDRAVIANATGCSSIYGGNLPTTPWAKNVDGRGPAWANSLFEDNAEFGLGFRVSLDKQRDFARQLLERQASAVGTELAHAILTCPQKDEAEIYEQRQRIEILKQSLRRLELKTRMHRLDSSDQQQLLALADLLVKKSVWIVGGDGWAYDIGFGGLDHVLASGRNVNILVLDTEVYSNTGGQMSKATPRAAVAKFAAAGKPAAKKDLGLIAMTYGNVYVASVAFGARDEHTLKAFIEAEAYDGPSIIIAYAHCIAHGLDMTQGLQHQKAAVESGQWLLYRYNPARAETGESALQIDTRGIKMKVEDFLKTENRFNMLVAGHPEESKELFAAAQIDADSRWRMYNYLAALKPQIVE
ncbi:MAG TPA: pyruvate:ferredoxin (flavodoxin) oxidoreductase [Thermoanaerobaculia bacterium]|nr:pyruvate:ferredoxin (flavodoxin) oxidoreductase [Thermoanaerobaculia bacterium]